MLIKIRKILSITLFLIMLSFAEVTRLAPLPDELRKKGAIEIRLDYIPKITLPKLTIQTMYYINSFECLQKN